MQEIQAIISESIEVKKQLLDDTKILEDINTCVEVIVQALKNGNKILLCGNGGSAADAQHLAAEFSGRFYHDRKALPAEALHVNTSYLTAVANDYSFDVVYARLLDGIGVQGDVLIGISTSGNSTNIVNALQVANTKGIYTIGFTGRSGGKMKDYCDTLIPVPSNDTPRIQECHILIGHVICQLAEQKYFDISQ